MKPLLLLLLPIYTSTLSNLAGAQLIEPELKSVTVFLNGSAMNYSCKPNIRTGRNRIILTGLSPHLQERSIHLSVDGTAEVLYVRAYSDAAYGYDDLAYRHLKDSLTKVREQITDLNIQKQGYMAELEFLKANRQMPSEQTVDKNKMSEIAEFHRTKTLEITRNILFVDEKLKIKEQQKDHLEKRIHHFERRDKNARMAVEVELESTEAYQANVELQFMTSHAGWAPLYNIRTPGVGGTIRLGYNAQIYNNTGIDWQEIPIRLSTGDPSLTNQSPKIDRWDVGRRVYSNVGVYDTTGKVNPHSDKSQKFQNLAVQALAVEFELQEMINIPSDAKPYTVRVTDYELQGSYIYRAIPKLDTDAFLHARITGWEVLNLIDGKASVYLGNTYVGETFISTGQIEDTLDISLGRDKHIKVQRIKTEEKSKRQVLGAHRRDTYSFELMVRNSYNIPLTIELVDQIPVSDESEVTVEQINLDGAVLNESTGEVTWTLHMEPGGNGKHILEFAIRYPKNRKIHSRSFRTVSAPSF